ncbi:hypothetical protein ACFQU2_03045 [Siccirubricoccus deserti]
MITPGEGNAGAARALLRQQSKALRGHVLRPVALASPPPSPACSAPGW